MREKKNGEFRSQIYEQRPAYADFDSAAKFTAIQGIIARRLKEHPNAICSYSGGSDSDILLDLIERVRNGVLKDVNNGTPPSVKYVFFNTGLELEATTAIERHKADQIINAIMGKETEDNFTITITIKEDEL